MKLLNQSLKYLSVSIFIIVSIWSVIFYVNMLDEIYDSIDDGLDNYKLLIIKKAETDTSVLSKSSFNESNYEITEIPKEKALKITDKHNDTLMYMEYEDDLEPVRMLTTAFVKGDKYYELRIISSMVEEDDLIEDLFWAIVWLYVFLIVSIMVVNNYVLKKLWKPFYGFLSNLKNFKIDKTENLPEINTTTLEFLELKKACDALISHSIETYHQQKKFTENASHELQTPLAVMRSKLELLLEKNTLENPDADTISEVLQLTSRLTNINKSLLLLSKIENKQFFETKNINLNKVVEKSVEDLEDFAQFKNIKIINSVSEFPEIKMDETLAQILISNLLKNAIFHNKENGKIEIKAEGNILKIYNTSAQGKLPENDIFKRFYKHSESRQSTGLGLAIVKAICQLYDYKITYHYNGMHGFEIDFYSY